MSTTTTTTTTIQHHQQPIKPKRVCFSFAAYSKNLIDHLLHSDVPVSPGLTDSEISSIESTFHFTFPPDLRSILQAGLPVGPGFPNWRSSSSQQLQILTSLPILGLSKEISRHDFWFGPWGDRPDDNDDAVDLAKDFLKNAPILVPIYRHCYIPSTPCLAGNPVYYVNGGDVKLWSYDVVAFFQQTEFKGNEGVLKRPSLSNLFSSPAWAQTEAKRIEFWTELAEIKEREAAARGERRVWWRGGALGGCLDEVCWRLRDGGWKEEEVREMMMIDGGDRKRSWSHGKKDPRDREALVWHVRLLSMRLLRAGWSRGDVVDSLGFLLEGHQQQHQNEIEIEIENENDGGGEQSSWFDFHQLGVNCDEAQNKKSSLRELMNIQSVIEV